MTPSDHSPSPLPAPEGDPDEALDFGSPRTRRRFIQQSAAAGAGVALLPYFPGGVQAEASEVNPPDPVPGNTLPVMLRINGQSHSLRVEPRTTLLDALRDGLHLTGSKKGCNHGQCGACTVLVNGRRINSCLALAIAPQRDEITTIEGLAAGDELHPVQAAFIKHDGFQCGYCTPGQICSAVALLAEAKANLCSVVTPGLRDARTVELTDAEIRERMSGNLCRCGAYTNIVAAIAEVHHQHAGPAHEPA